MDYGQFTIGRVVKKIKSADSKVPIEGFLGHVIGFDIVDYENGCSVIINVRWWNGEEYAIHPANVVAL